MINSVTDQLLVNLSEKVNARHYGKYRGVVDDIADPQNIGRLRAIVPKLFKGVATPWATPCAPYVGDGEGLFMIPPKGAGVWIEFEEGDLNRPIWSGGWWKDQKAPKNESGADSAITRKIIRSKTGLVLALDDDAKKISLSDDGAKNFITIEVQNGKVKIQAATKVVVEAPQIELVENATHPLVFGDDLLTFLNQMINIYTTHTHPGELALGVFPVTPMTPVPPMPPATPALLSVKVKTG
jgi:Type VI secretion system/phage-baseplate injector OB domain